MVESVRTAVFSTHAGGCVSTGAVSVVIKALESAELGWSPTSVIHYSRELLCTSVFSALK